jgi:hypothetical protein
MTLWLHLGDINNDTFADITIGAPYAGSQSCGAAYVIYGKATSFVLIDLSNLSPLDGYAIMGVSSSDALGISVSGAGTKCVNCIAFIT